MQIIEANKQMLDELTDEEYKAFLAEHPEYVKYIKDMNYERKKPKSQ